MKITYYVQQYRPEYEAVSKEVHLLNEYFSQTHVTRIHNLHLDNLFEYSYNRKMISYHFCYYPVLFPFTYWASKKSDINHIYTSLGDLPYLNIINLKKTILTAAASCNTEKVKKRIKLLEKVPCIVTETELQRGQLEKLGINKEKIKLISPAVDTSSFSYRPASGNFKIIYASCPTRSQDFDKRGIFMLLDFARRNRRIQLTLIWRIEAAEKMEELLRREKNKNILLKNKIIEDMNQEYGKVHESIIPYTKYDNFLKLIPNSALESLAAGKPLLVSTKTELAKIVEKHKCGVTFDPSENNLQEAFLELEKNYELYQMNCRTTAEKLFSKDRFLREYALLYQELHLKEMEERS